MYQPQQNVTSRLKPYSIKQQELMDKLLAKYTLKLIDDKGVYLYQLK